MSNDMSVKVSVCCVCYNHGEYLESTLDGILSQKVNFDFEIIIYDDCSTDNSREIIDFYKDKYSNIFQIIYAESNNYSKGIRPLSYVIPRVRGEFIAFCECDDYWTDDYKLQKQFDALRLYQNVDICFHSLKTLESGVLRDYGYGDYGNQPKIIPAKEVVKVSGGMMPMASIFIRAEKMKLLYEREPEFFRYLLRHSAIQILNSDSAGALYLPNIGGVYRFMHAGSWSHTQSIDKIEKKKTFIEFSHRNKELNRITEGRYFWCFKFLYARRLVRYIKNNIFA